MALDPNSDEQQAVLWIEQRLDDAVDRLWTALRPIWKSAENVCQALLWLSSGALVASVSITQIYLGEIDNFSWGIILPVSWGLLVLTLILSLARLGKFLEMRSGPFRYEAQKKDLRQFVRRVYDEPDAEGRIDEKIESILENAWEVPAEAIESHDRLAKMSAVTFILAVIGLSVFTIKNLPIL